MSSSAMPTNAETMALCIVRDVHEYTGGHQQRWAPLDTIAALDLGVDRRWFLVEGGHSVALTDAGKRLAS